MPLQNDSLLQDLFKNPAERRGDPREWGDPSPEPEPEKKEEEEDDGAE